MVTVGRFWVATGFGAGGLGGGFSDSRLLMVSKSELAMSVDEPTEMELDRLDMEVGLLLLRLLRDMANLCTGTQITSRISPTVSVSHVLDHAFFLVRCDPRHKRRCGNTCLRSAPI